jgi:hypothetical protein
MTLKKIVFVFLPVLWSLLIIINPALGFLGGNKVLKSRRPFNYIFQTVRGLRSVTMFFLIVINIFLMIRLQEASKKEHSF